MGVYHIGVACCIQKFAIKYFKSLDRIYGCSAGSMIAIALLTDLNMETALRNILKIADEIHKRPLGPLNPRFRLGKMLQEGLEQVCPEDIHNLATDKIYISLTRVSDQKNVIVSKFNSKQHFIDAIQASSFVPFYSGIIPPTFNNVAYVDGGISDNLPGDDNKTIKISPFAGISSISPTDEDATKIGHIYLKNNSFDLSISNLNRLKMAFLPPNHDDFLKLCKQGYLDAYKFFMKNGLMDRHRTTHDDDVMFHRDYIINELAVFNQNLNYSLSNSNRGVLPQIRKRRDRFHSVSENPRPKLQTASFESPRSFADRRRSAASFKSTISSKSSRSHEPDLPAPVIDVLNTAKFDSQKMSKRLFKMMRFLFLPIVYPVQTSINNLENFLVVLPWLPSMAKFAILWYFSVYLRILRYIMPKWVIKLVKFSFNLFFGKIKVN